MSLSVAITRTFLLGAAASVLATGTALAQAPVEIGMVTALSGPGGGSLPRLALEVAA